MKIRKWTVWNWSSFRYHLSGSYKFSEEAIRFICAEIGSALDFLRTKRIIHRDVKPDNILLDEHGHAHLTDFNVATKLKSNDGKTGHGWNKIRLNDSNFMKT